jgi:two-component system chemotaxis sensor kinase CheA
MRARLQPVGTVTGKFRRVVRDLATAMGKQITIDIEGEDIGVDKAVNEALRDPLLHLVRNAADHGIESPAERLAAGKPAMGTLTLRAFHEGGRVRIELTDDGRGVDPGRLVEKAIASGALSVEEAAELSADEALNLMFLPGLSTKDDVTNISGRGVGMDVVRSALELVGGSIDVSSEPGRGSVFRLNVPLTLAIMPVLIASIGSERYAVPQVDVQEVLRIAAEDMADTVHDVDGARIYRLRDRLVPLVDLAAQFDLDRPIGAESLVVVVVETNRRRFGIVVDAIGDTTDVVVKPLTRAIRSIRMFAGITILGDGEPALILDVAGLASSAGITTTRDHDDAERRVEPEDATSMLLVASGADDSRVAIGMAAVRRLEQIASDAVERWGPFEVVQYRDGILPLVRVADMLPNGTPTAPADVLHIVVCEASIGMVGLVVGRIEDVVARPAAAAGGKPPDRRGVIETLVVNGRVTELLDVEMLIADAGIGRTA